MDSFYNGDLRFRIKNILDNFNEQPENLKDEQLLPRKSFDDNLDSPYIIDVLEEAFFYHSEDERDHDFAELWIQIKR